jgi:O-antigen ligase
VKSTSGINRINWDILLITRLLLLGEFISLFISTAAAVGLEGLLYICFLLSKNLRRRLFDTFSQPMIKATLLWASIVLLGALYSEGTTQETLHNLASWRKLLLIPFAAALLNNDKWRLRVVWTLILLAALGMTLSYFSWFSGIHLYKYEIGIAIVNHTTQGMLFAVSLFAIATLLKFTRPAAYGGRWFLLLSAGGTAANLIFVTPGRSGYLVLLVLTGVVSMSWTSGKPRYILALLFPALLTGLLFLSPVASQRIRQGLTEIKNFDKQEEITSMGIRMIMWKNTLELIKTRPLFGCGTGGFEAGYRRITAGKKGLQGQAVGDPHNQFLRILAEQGLLGLLVFLLLIGSFFHQQSRRRWRTLGIGVLVAWCASSMFSAHFSTFVEGRFIMFWCGTMLTRDLQNESDRAVSAITPLKHRLE